MRVNVSPSYHALLKKPVIGMNIAITTKMFDRDSVIKLKVTITTIQGQSFKQTRQKYGKRTGSC